MSEKHTLLPSSGSGREDASTSTYVLRRKKFFIALFAVLAIAAIVIGVVLAKKNDDDDDNSNTNPNGYSTLAMAVTAENIGVHLNKLYQIAASDPKFQFSRAVTRGYNKSAEFIISTLNEIPECNVSTQFFRVPVYTEFTSPRLILNKDSVPELELQYGQDFAGLRYGGGGTYNITATISVVAGGCNASDFANFTAGTIALIEVEDEVYCDYGVRGLNAENASAVGILFRRTFGKAISGSRVLIGTWKEGDPLVTIPAIGVSYTTGQILKSYTSQGGLVNLITNTSVVVANTYNVFCDWKTGDPNNVVIVGAHLDSVDAGPGINDNGSGSSTILEIARQLHNRGTAPTNKVKFAWWGAEELGLLGSRFYVQDLITKPAEFAKIALNLNFDMLASPNYVRIVYDGTTTPSNVRNASTTITKLFQHHFANVTFAPYELAAMSGGSDYYSFSENGIPAGALATGASAIKTVAQRDIFGGFTNAQLDPSYHKFEDDYGNYNVKALADMSFAAASVIDKLITVQNLREYLVKGAI